MIKVPNFWAEIGFRGRRFKRLEGDANCSAVVNKVFKCLNLARSSHYLVNALVVESLTKSSA
jgi:hypothetical protein